MNKLLVYIAIAVAVVALVVALQKSNTFGGVASSDGYYATSTAALADGHDLIRTGPTLLGSVVIASSSAATITIWNATSTTDTASSTFATIKASLTEGTYVFDAVLERGLVVEMGASSNGSGAITFKAQ